jgi:chemotaxis methyl-accepting protein methylase
LRAQYGIDFAHYKPSTVTRRIERRLALTNQLDLGSYAKVLAADPDELNQLYKDLLIGVTRFFRDPEAFECLQSQVVPQIISRVAPNEEIRVWCAACATGEEAWTLACVWNETAPGRSFRIYASDISNKALRRAYAGEYAKDSCAPLPATWLSRYFERLQKPQPRFRVNAQLRAQVEFKRINLMERLPWQRQFPAIFCRNVMIYFDRQTQQDVVRRLTDCLEPGGYFFTGHAESLAGISHSLEYVQPALYRKPGGRRSA